MSTASSGARVDGPVPVSVVLPCYNSEATLHRAVASVAAQSARVLETIAIDDGSTDGTYEVLRALQAEHGERWLKIARFDRNRGVGATRNAGWAVAAGEYVAFLDADDTWHPRKVALQYAVMRAHPRASVCAHAHTFLEAPPDPATITISTLRPRALLWRNRFVTPSVMVRRELAARFREGQRHMEDHLLWMQLAFTGHEIVLIDQPLATLYKPAFGSGGLSADLLAMERAELGNYRLLWRERHIGALMLGVLSVWSGTKFARRLAIAGWRRLRA